MARLLVLYVSEEGQTERIAGRIAAAAGARGYEVRLTDLAGLEATGLEAADGVIVGASVHVGHHPRALRDWVRAERDWLAARPSAFFSVSLVAATPEGRGGGEARHLLDTFLEETGWRPERTAVFAGALRYSRYGLLKRFVMKSIARRAGSKDLDTHRDYEYTDWDGVERFADDFLALLPSDPDA